MHHVDGYAIMIRGEYWWVYCRADGMDWSQWLSGESVPLREGSCTVAAEIPAPDGASLVLCVPGEQVRIYNVKAPARNRSRFFASLPYALEDKLLHPPEAYHFVPLAKAKALKTVPVAVISRDYLHTLLERFHLRDWQPKLLLPDYLFIEGPGPVSWSLDLSNKPFLLRQSAQATGSVLAGEIAMRPPGALILALEQDETPPSLLRVRVANADDRKTIESWSEALEDYPLQLDIVEDNRSRAAWLSRFPLPAMEMNLLTGPYAVSGQTRKQLRQFLPAATLAAAIVLVLIVNWFVEGSRLETDYSQLQSAIEQTYRGVFPNARNLVDPRYQMEQQLIRLTAASKPPTGQDFDFLASLEQLASIITGGDSQLQRLEFDGSNIIIDLTVADYDALESLQQRLGATMELTVDSAELRDGVVHSRISLEAGT